MTPTVTQPPQPLRPSPPLPVITAGVGSYLRTSEGRWLLDGCSGAININLGHGNRAVKRALRRQLDAVSFTYRSQCITPVVAQLRDRLGRLLEGRYPDQAFTNSGSEAVEQALRIAFRFHQLSGQRERRVVLAEQPSYHGMTLGALAASGHPPRWHSASPLLSAVHGTRFRHVSAARAPGARASAAAWEAAIRQAGSELAAVVIEPVGGASSGAATCPPQTLQAVRAAADRVGAVVISDEVMTGLGRVGEWSPAVTRGLDPDLIVISKGLGAGYYPVGAVLVTRGLADVLAGLGDFGSFGHTMAGSPLGAAVGLAVLEELESRQILAEVCDRASALRATLAAAVSGCEYLGPPRGEGFLYALPVHLPGVDPSGGDDQPAGSAAHDAAALQRAKAFAAAALAEDLLVYPAGVDRATACVLLAPPLTAGDTTVAELGSRLERAAWRFERS